MAGTFSLAVTGTAADSLAQVSNWDVPDAACQGVGDEQQYMQKGTSFLAKLPDGSKAMCVYDAERSIPGVSLVLRRLY